MGLFDWRTRKPVTIDAASARIDEQVYLLNYRDHYAEILGDQCTTARLAELFLFRAWTAQLGYRLFSTDPRASERLIAETVNATKYLGLGVFETVHGFSIESTLGSDFISLIEDRWRNYDDVLIESQKIKPFPTVNIIAALSRRLDLIDPCATYSLSIHFLAQMELVKRTAIELGILRLKKRRWWLLGH
jgi:hypothetical protein